MTRCPLNLISCSQSSPGGGLFARAGRQGRMKPGGLEGDRIICKQEGWSHTAADQSRQVARDYELAGACATQEASWASSRPVRRSATVITADGCSRCAIRADV